MTAFYNEINAAAADWLENLIAGGIIAPGVVDRRSITELEPHDLDGFTQVHLFAGIGGWSRAARLAGWPDDRPLWTASCPCQPFSVAGKGAGEDDPRHLWPHVLRLSRAKRPAVIVGEQVAKKAGYGWFDGVRSGLEGEDYACRAVDIPALAVDSPHERNRLYWVAVDNAVRLGNGIAGAEVCAGRNEFKHADGQREAAGVTQGDACCARLEGQRGNGDGQAGRSQSDRSTPATDERGNVADANPARQFQRQRGPEGMQPDSRRRHLHGHGRNGSWWSGADWITCHDDKIRRVADASAPLLAHGVRGRIPVPRPPELCPTAHPEEVRWVSRVAAWEGFGNAIVQPLAAEVIGALADYLDGVE